MESLKVYQDSLAEIKSVEHRMSFDTLTINLSKLDGETKNEIINALSNVLKRRKNAVIDVIQGVH